MADLKVALEELLDESAAQPAATPRRKSRYCAAGWLSLCVLALGATLWYFKLRGPTATLESSATRLTIEGGSAIDPAISADGKLLAYASDREGNFDIYVQQIGSTNAIRVTNSPFDGLHPVLHPMPLRLSSHRSGMGVCTLSQRSVVNRGYWFLLLGAVACHRTGNRSPIGLRDSRRPSATATALGWFPSTAKMLESSVPNSSKRLYRSGLRTAPIFCFGLARISAKGPIGGLSH